VPEPWRTLGRWRVRAGGAVACPGERVPLPAGRRAVRVEAWFAAPGFQAEGSLEVEVDVVAGGVSEIALPLDVLPGMPP
jgi:hypothetical protein